MKLMPWEIYWQNEADIDFMRGPEEVNHPLRIRMCNEAARVGGKVLDVGCGTAIDYTRLTSLGLEYTGVDPIPKFIARAKQLYPGIRIHQARCWDLPFEDDSIDVVYNKGVVQHLPPGTYAEALKEMWRVADKLLLVSTNRVFLSGNQPDLIHRERGGPYSNHYNFKIFNGHIRSLRNSVSKNVKGFVKPEDLEEAKRTGLIHTLFIIYNRDYWEGLEGEGRGT